MINRILLQILCIISFATYSCQSADLVSHSTDWVSYDFHATQKLRPTKFTSFDGGGIRGLYSLMITEEIEKGLGAPITDYCKCFTGTSTGGLIALGYASGKTTTQLIDLYSNHADKIFTRSYYHEARSLCGLIDEKYETQPLEEEIIKFFGKETTLQDLSVADVIIPSTDITTNTALFFNSYQAKLHPKHNYPLWQVARATSAAPTFFEPLELNGKAMVDGGLIANNPSLVSGIILEKIFPMDCTNNFNVISIGTGNYKHGISYDQAKTMGVAQWASPISSTIMKSTSNMYDMLCATHYGKTKYVRLNGILEKDIPLDGISLQDIEQIKESATHYIKEHPEDIKKAVELLKK